MPKQPQPWGNQVVLAFPVQILPIFPGVVLLPGLRWLHYVSLGLGPWFPHESFAWRSDALRRKSGQKVAEGSDFIK